ncbi:MAG: hypothetical protein GY758_08810 [Fuerstiella sp.]|nr:hypothetical protein [Fuerstiella sp.]MCP4505514.1 hypothetical protein [Fuerstiella sp.]
MTHIAGDHIGGSNGFPNEADHRQVFGYRWAEVTGAFVNLLLLTFVGLYLMYKANARHIDPQELMGWLTVFFLYDMAGGAVNLRAGLLHKSADAPASVRVIPGGVAILLNGGISFTC